MAASAGRRLGSLVQGELRRRLKFNVNEGVCALSPGSCFHHTHSWRTPAEDVGAGRHLRDGLRQGRGERCYSWTSGFGQGTRADGRGKPQDRVLPEHAAALKTLATRSNGARILDGRKVAQQWQLEIAGEVSQLTSQVGRPPGLAVVLVGNRADSVLYVNRKRQASAKVGINFDLIQLPEKVTQERLLERLDALFLDDRVDGVIVQLPLPRHIDEEAILEHIDPLKDVDGFHPLNVGRLAMRGVRPTFVPCTPLGAVELLKREGVALSGTKAVILGNSNTVGIPLSMLLRDEGCASVTVCHCTALDFAEHGNHQVLGLHSQDRDIRAVADACLPPLQAGGGSTGGGKRHIPASRLGSIPEVTRMADLLFVAIGHPELVKRSWVKEGCIVVDIGINAKPVDTNADMDELCKQMLANGLPPTGRYDHVEIVGDVAFEEVSEVASCITPVPGGAGPMTIAALMSNLIESYKTSME